MQSVKQLMIQVDTRSLTSDQMGVGGLVNALGMGVQKAAMGSYCKDHTVMNLAYLLGIPHPIRDLKYIKPMTGMCLAGDLVTITFSFV